MSQYLDKDGASRIAENFLLKQAEQDAILANLQFDIKEAEHALVKTIQGPAPLNIRALTRPLDDYRISGNTIQNGTPTPDAPIYPDFVGERTENLFGVAIEQGTFNTETGEVYRSNERVRSTDFITQIGQITVNTSSNNYVVIYIYDADGTYHKDESIIAWQSCPYTFTITSGKKFKIAFRKPDNSRIYLSDVTGIMLNAGTTAKPYEPYGYKLPLTVNSTEYPIYLGNVQTTRRIKKLVLTGKENWGINASTKVFYCGISQALIRAGVTTSACTHYKALANLDKYVYLFDNSCCIRWDDSVLWIRDLSRSNADDFKSYLQQQYAAGTPVTVWYVLAEPETGIVNEPLMKIGDYADTITMAQAGVEISTAKGFNTITTDTTVLPSNIEVKGVINNA